MAPHEHDVILIQTFIVAVYGICVLSVPACGALIYTLWPQVRNTRRGVFARQLMHLTVADLMVTSWVLGFELQLRPWIALRTDYACSIFKAGCAPLPPSVAVPRPRNHPRGAGSTRSTR